MNKEFHYSVEGFYPRASTDFRDRFNFTLYLDRNISKLIKGISIDEKIRKRFQEIGQEDLKNMGKKWYEPYLFHENSLLISQINIESDGRWLASSRDDILELDKEKPFNNFVRYNSHNIDTPEQAYALLALFTRWLDFTKCFTDKEVSKK